MALAWFKSYLCGRHQIIKIDKSFSDSRLLEHGVPQGSVLGPLLFSLYTAPLSTIISSYGLIGHHLYADDTQIYISLTGDTATDRVTKNASELYYGGICLDSLLQTKTQS